MRYSFFPGCSYHASAGYRESTEAVVAKLGIDLVEIEDWNCCGATVIYGESRFKATALVARIFALAQAKGFSEIVTGCNACYTTLRKAAKIISHDADCLKRINNLLQEEGLSLKKEIKIRHLADVLINDVPESLWRDNIVTDNSNINVASYYGCQMTRPWGDIDNPEKPELLETFFKRLGFGVTTHSAGTFCCGASLAVPHAEDCKPLTNRIIREIEKKGGDIITTVCPLCQFNLDNGQKYSSEPDIPVTFFTQIAGLALGISPSTLGLNKPLISTRNVLSRSL